MTFPHRPRQSSVASCFVFLDAALEGIYCAESRSDRSQIPGASSFPGEARANGGGERPPQEADAGVAVPEAAAGVQAERRGRGGGGRRGRGHHDDHAEAGGREKGPGELTGAAVKTEGGVKKRLPSDVVDDDCST